MTDGHPDQLPSKVNRLLGTIKLRDEELIRKALETLKEVPHAYKCSTYDEEADVPVDDGRCDCHLVAVNAVIAKLEERLLRE